MKLGSPWVVRHWSETYFVHVDSSRPATNDEELRASRRALFVLLSDYRGTTGALDRDIEEIHHALYASEPLLDARPDREQVTRDLERAVRVGRLRLVPAPPPPRVIHRTAMPAIPEGMAPSPEPEPTFFEARLVDEIGEPISGLKVIVTSEGKANELTTDGSGKVRLDGAQQSFATLRVASMQSLREILEPRWEKARSGKLPSQEAMTRTALVEDLSGIGLQSELEHLIVFTPPVGKIFLELFDRSGRVRHANRKYTIEGPMSFSGTTDENGRLFHDDVIAGDYTLKLTLSFFEGTKDAVTEEYEAALVVLDGGTGAPQQRMIGAVPFSVFARARGFLFDTYKTFLLPSAIPALEKLRDVYEQNNPSELLIVGHTDTTGEPSTNDPLSVERAKSVKAYLEDDVDTWLKYYDASGKQKWGAREDRAMITALPDHPLRPRGEKVLEWFQRTRGLAVDGIAGPVTRKQLITEYMALDGTSLKGDSEFKITIKTHGAGENFPLADTGIELDAQAVNGKADPIDRRAELFFFDAEFGVKPAPGAAKGPEYLTWRKNVSAVHDFGVDAATKNAIVIEVHDALFRTNSCVVLPDGEAPSEGAHQAITSVGLFATALRFNEQHGDKSVFIAGHTDTTSTVEANQKLSEERAKCALALLVGDRGSFVTLANARHTVADYKQILSFFSVAFAGLAEGEGGFACAPGAIDDDAPSGEPAVKLFQAQYNKNKQAIGASAGDLAVDGIVGPLVWGAFFDVLEFALRRKLGLDAEGLKTLRARLVFVDDDRKALGFSEHFPIDQVGRDNVRSQANRRVEVLFFEPGEEPDLVSAESDPKLSELYLPGEYKQETIVISPEELKGGVERNPVYFCTLKEDVPILNAPAGGAIGTAKKGQLFRVIAEQFEEEAFFVRVEPVAANPPGNYYVASAPKPEEQWLQASAGGQHFAFWSNLEGVDLSANAGAMDFNTLDDRSSIGTLDV